MSVPIRTPYEQALEIKHTVGNHINYNVFLPFKLKLY